MKNKDNVVVKKQEQDKISSDIENFLQKGGAIEKIASGVSGAPYGRPAVVKK